MYLVYDVVLTEVCFYSYTCHHNYSNSLPVSRTVATLVRPCTSRHSDATSDGRQQHWRQLVGDMRRDNPGNPFKAQLRSTLYIHYTLLPTKNSTLPLTNRNTSEIGLKLFSYIKKLRVHFTFMCKIHFVFTLFLFINHQVYFFFSIFHTF